MSNSPVDAELTVGAHPFMRLGQQTLVQFKHRIGISAR